MLEHSQNPEYWVNFFKKIHANNITTLHSSIEYDSFPLLCEVLRRLQQKNIEFEHVIKLAEPSFLDSSFSANRFLYKISVYQELLNTDHIDTIQWMWRQGIKKDQRRIEEFLESMTTINKSFTEIRKTDTKIMCFPYSVRFASESIKSGIFDGLIVYWNPLEKEYMSNIFECQSLGKEVYSIRPFAAGEAEGKTRELLDFTFDRELISSTILTATKKEHIDSITQYIKNHEKNI